MSNELVEKIRLNGWEFRDPCGPVSPISVQDIIDRELAGRVMIPEEARKPLADLLRCGKYEAAVFDQDSLQWLFNHRLSLASQLDPPEPTDL